MSYHNHQCTMAFGRPSKHSQCPRCEELKQGAAPRQGWGSIKKQQDQRRSEAIRNHYRSGECAVKCGPVCTAFEY